MPYILTISELGHSWAGRGPVRSNHKTAEDARTALRDYVARNWDAEVGTERPNKPDEMVQEYFSEVLEAYDISEIA
jgi:hypothetical protein